MLVKRSFMQISGLFTLRDVIGSLLGGLHQRSEESHRAEHDASDDDHHHPPVVQTYQGPAGTRQTVSGLKTDQKYHHCPAYYWWITITVARFQKTSFTVSDASSDPFCHRSIAGCFLSIN